jgi:pimeloyl-ACP methyl ester carboxylesterase
MIRTLNGSTANLTFTDSGEGEATLIFLHYWGGSARTWAPVIARLEPHARCVALNLRGWGGSSALDGRYGLDAMAEDVTTLISALEPKAFVLVGHSMGGKVAQMVAKRAPTGLRGLVLVAPAPPTPMKVPEAQRAAMLASYQTCEGVHQALGVVAASALPEALREQVIADTLAGHPDAKRSWTEAGMLEDVSTGLDTVSIPVEVVVGDRDQVERHDDLRAAFTPILPQARFRILPGTGHLSPLEDPAAIMEACASMLRLVGLNKP